MSNVVNELVVVVNPKAGRVGKLDIASKVSASLQKNDVPFQMIVTKHPGHATSIVNEFYARGYRDFFCLGGDGTLYEMVNGVFQNRNNVDSIRLAVIPTGTGNSFLKDFSENIDQTLHAFLEKKTKPCDVIEVTHAKGKLYFVNIFSFGFTSDVGQLRNDYFSFAGHAGYIFAVICKVMNLTMRPYSLTLDQTSDITGRSTFISINNTRFTGGNMMMAPHAIPNDGKVDVIHVQEMGRIKLLQAFPKIFKGTHIQMPEVVSHQAHHIDFHIDHEISVMVDGELIHIQPKSLRVLTQGIQIYA